jgi:hypothetical protein
MGSYELANMASPKHQNGSPPASPVEWSGSEASNESGKSDSDSVKLAGMSCALRVKTSHCTDKVR